jgi:hypothetical protein
MEIARPSSLDQLGQNVMPLPREGATIVHETKITPVDLGSSAQPTMVPAQFQPGAASTFMQPKAATTEPIYLAPTPMSPQGVEQGALLSRPAPAPATPALFSSMAAPMSGFGAAPLQQSISPVSSLETAPANVIPVAPGEGLEQLLQFQGVRMVQVLTQEEIMAGVERKVGFTVFGLNAVANPLAAGAIGMPANELSLNRQIFNIQEQFGLGSTAYHGAKKPYAYLVYNQRQLPIMKIVRKWRGFKTYMKVYDGAGRFIGSIRKTRTATLQKRMIMESPDGRELFWIKMSGFNADWQKLGIFHTATDPDANFLNRKNKVRLGDVWRRRGAFRKSAITDANEIDCVFPALADVNGRSLLLAATLYLDLLWHEKGMRKSRQGYA